MCISYVIGKYFPNCQVLIETEILFAKIFEYSLSFLIRCIVIMSTCQTILCVYVDLAKCIRDENLYSKCIRTYDILHVENVILRFNNFIVKI